ncbi:hypothetical protein EUGRSUZ_G00881 [Eucalyptus grandis]|uniref:Uncharacterized protein n=2 Tax=Eucalyptus grandis TaxID=71139 RepID=A0ACC3K145_EUCGR|nr:hypothetical protein EUGRSUZ_G00881 [Eucalyptus grandis]
MFLDAKEVTRLGRHRGVVQRECPSLFPNCLNVADNVFANGDEQTIMPISSVDVFRHILLFLLSFCRGLA